MIPNPALGTVFVALIALAGFAACDEVPAQTPCQSIPTGGCPNTSDSVCQDPTCASIYDCVNGDWVYDHTCPAPEGGTGPADSAPYPDVIEEPQPLRDANFDAPPGSGGGPGCPDLEPPDCTLDTALACPSDSCCDCEDLYYCQNGGWQLWGECDADGGLLVASGTP